MSTFIIRRLILSGFLLALLSACGLMSHRSDSPASAVTPVALAASSSQLVLEPQAGVTPWLRLIAQARTGIDVNAYLFDNTAIAQALRQAGSRGVPVHVLLTPNPYGATGWVAREQRLLATIPHGVVRRPPGRFVGSYAFDHAKYLVINPGTPHVQALIGSANFTESATDGTNLEAGVRVTGAPAQAAAAVFHADWTDQAAGPGPRQSLILSPGAQAALTTLLHSPGPIDLTAEELGDDPALDQALAEDGARLHLLLAAPLSSGTRRRAQALARAGVMVRTLTHPVVHAKVLITASQAFVGSENLSFVSLAHNREMGCLVRGTARTTLIQWFAHYWALAQPLTPSSHAAAPSPATSSSASSSASRPWLSRGMTMAAVQAAWGAPLRTYATVYHGQAQQAWAYAHHTVYFVYSRVVAVTDQGTRAAS